MRAHNATSKGIAVIAQGTPTNNTDAQGAGYTTRDDADASFDRVFVTRSLPDAEDWRVKTDGQWLADALGLDPALVHGIAGAFGTDQAEAMLANTALWPATLGYFMETMMAPVFSLDAIDAVRDFFLDNVSGRGRLPALRIGRQPYGLVVTTAMRRLQLGGRVASVPRTWLGKPRVHSAEQIATAIHAITATVAADWTALAAAVPRLGSGSNIDRTLLDVIGLHPASVEFAQRYAESTAAISALMHFDGLGEVFLDAWDRSGSVVTAQTLLRRLGYAGAVSPDVLSKVFRGAYVQLHGPVVDTALLSETDALRSTRTDGANYLRFLADHGSRDLEAVRLQTGFEDGKPPIALLYALARHALMLGWRRSAVDLRESAGLIDSVLRTTMLREPAFVHIGNDSVREAATSWSALYTPAEPLTGNASLSLHKVMPSLLSTDPLQHLGDVVDALDRLAGLPTARLERLFAEHIDLASHRLDSWRLGAVHHRLRMLRAIPGGRTAPNRTGPRRGLHIGTFAVLEEPRPDTRPVTQIDPRRAAHQRAGGRFRPPDRRTACCRSSERRIHACAIAQPCDNRSDPAQRASRQFVTGPPGRFFGAAHLAADAPGSRGARRSPQRAGPWGAPRVPLRTRSPRRPLTR